MGFRLFTGVRSSKIETAAPQLPIDRRLRQQRSAAQRLKLPRSVESLENFGLIALAVFGLALMSLGGSLLFNGRGDVIEVAGAAALVAPGLAAVLIAALGLWRGPRDVAA
jgi:hypothetical protein